MIKLKVALDEKRSLKSKFLTFERQLQESLPHAVDNFLKSLICDKMADYSETEEKSNLLELSLNSPFYSCAVFQFNEFINSEPLKSSIDTSKEINKYLTEYLVSQGLGYSFYSNQCETVALLNFDIPSQSIASYTYLSEVIKNIQSILIKKFESLNCLSLTVGVGNIYRNILSYPISYQQACTALKRIFFDPDNTLFYSWNEKSTFASFITEYPYNKENDLINAVLQKSFRLKERCERCSFTCCPLHK
ncbi:MAG TPA: hypothetical protein VIK78_15575 [Ruminiclostridium sp.]